MKNLIVKEIRECASVKGKQKTWIAKLNNERLYQLFLMLKTGSSSRTIAEHVRGVWEVNKESSINSIAQGIQKFKKRVEHLLVNDSPPADKAEPDPCIEDDKTDVLEINQRLAGKLRSRIEQMMREEKEKGVAYPNLNKDVLALNSLEKTILKEIEWRMKNKDQLLEEYEKRQEREIGHRFDNFIEKHLPTDESRKLMVDVLSGFLEMVEQESVLMRENDDGTFSPVNKKGEGTLETIV